MNYRMEDIQDNLQKKFCEKFYELCSIAKLKNNKHLAYYEFQQDYHAKGDIENEKVFVVGRPSISLSSNYIYLMNYFGNIGGFDALIKFN